MSTGGDLCFAADFARELAKVWRDVTDKTIGDKPIDDLPSRRLVRGLVETCYQASLATEEGRPTRFRVLLQDREVGDHKLSLIKGSIALLETPVPLSVIALKKLAPACDFSSTLICVDLDSNGHFHIWGILGEGNDWLRGLRAEVYVFNTLSVNSLVIGVTSPGNITAYRGSLALLRLRRGKIVRATTDVYNSNVVREVLRPLADGIKTYMEKTRDDSPAQYRTIDPMVFWIPILLHLKRMVVLASATGHGAAFVILPGAHDYSSVIDVKYKLKQSGMAVATGSTVRSLLHSITQVTLMTRTGTAKLHEPDHLFDRYAYVSEVEMSPNLNTNSKVDTLHGTSAAIASFTQVDGLVVLDQELNVRGFGGVIAETLPEPEYALSVDLATGKELSRLYSKNVGTRHRSMFRLCCKFKDALGIVASQDGDVRFFRHDGTNLCVFEQVGTSMLDA